MSRAPRTLLMGFFLAWFALPFVWLLSAPFSKTPGFRLAFPDFTLENFPRLLETRGALHAFGNSLLLAGVTMIVVGLTATLAAYALSRQSFRGRDLVLYLLVLFSSVVTGVAAVVPLFTITLKLGLLDTHLGVILVLCGGLLPTAMFVIKDFVDGIPRAYEEASLMDGATPWQTFRNVALPLSTGGLAVVSLLTFVSAWDNFLIPYILLRSPERFPASVAIYSFFNELGLPFLNVLAAYALLYTLPVLALYLIIQKVFGFELYGGIKG
ncbi:MAG: carbohydrate ABC transporter permease [Armatimonadetes bacterium]|nr:carbohydrate ABC transporter permease [Armatimonadota bacterium]